jgi:hypothetical protein
LKHTHTYEQVAWLRETTSFLVGRGIYMCIFAS